MKSLLQKFKIHNKIYNLLESRCYLEIIEYFNTPEVTNYLTENLAKFGEDHKRSAIACCTSLGLAYLSINEYKKAQKIFNKINNDINNEIKEISNLFNKCKLENNTPQNSNRQKQITKYLNQFKLIYALMHKNYANLAACCTALNKYKKAVSYLELAAKMDKNNINYKMLLAEAYYHKRNQDVEHWKFIFKLILLFLIALIFIYYFNLTSLNLLILIPVLSIIYKYFSLLLKFTCDNLFFIFSIIPDFLPKSFKKLEKLTRINNIKYYQKILTLLEKEADSWHLFLSRCKLYYFLGEYDKAHQNAQLALSMSKTDKKDIYIYDWLSRIAYKTKNHLTAEDFYKKIIEIIATQKIDENQKNEIHPIPDLNKMVEYLQTNRDILNKRAVHRIFIPLVLTLLITLATGLSSVYFTCDPGKIKERLISINSHFNKVKYYLNHKNKKLLTKFSVKE